MESACKTCITCGQTLSLSEFHAKPGAKDGRHAECKECKRIRTRARTYGLTAEETRQLLQVPCCQACGVLLESERLKEFDHCHANNHVRGVLCGDCNRMAAGPAEEFFARAAAVGKYLLRDLERQGTPCEKLIAQFSVTSPPSSAPAPSAGGPRAMDDDEWRSTILSVVPAASMTDATSSRSAKTVTRSSTAARR